MRIDRTALAAIRCRFGCDDPPVGIFHVPEGCICWTDPLQALCWQHAEKAQSTGPMDCVVSFVESFGSRRTSPVIEDMKEMTALR